MNLIDEISSSLGNVTESYCFSVYGAKGGYFEGVKSIVYFGEEIVKLEIKKAQITIKGEKLCIKKYASGDVAVGGRISSVEII